MAKFVAANAGDGEKKDLAALRTTDFEELKTLFRKTAQQAIQKNEKIYELLREQLPVYPA